MTAPKLTGAEIVARTGQRTNGGDIMAKLAALVDAVAKHIDDNGTMRDAELAEAYGALIEEAKR